MQHRTWRTLLFWALILPLACGTTEDGNGDGDGDKKEDVVVDAGTTEDAAAEDTAKAEPDVVEKVDLGPPNKPPVATDDLAATFSGNPVEITVLYNDIDPDGDKLKINETTQGKHGTVGIIYGGTVLEYTPIDAAWVGIDSFTYTVTDNKGGTDVGNVAVNCKGLPTLEIIKPKDNEVITGETVKIEFKVTGCKFTHPSNSKAGCHAHTFLDGKGWKKKGSSGIGHYVTAPVSVTPLTAGVHSFGLQLIRNDGSDGPWQPSIEDAVKFELK